MPRALATFRAERPEVQLTVHELGSAEQLHALEEGRIDVGFVLVPSDAGKLTVEVVREERLVVVTARL